MAQKERIGIVVSNKMMKTAVVAVKTTVPHKKYGKILSRTKHYKIHDENNICDIGDIVKIQETRPLSKTKFWRLTKKIGQLHN
uniref:Small ribosomal subunit protein uS17c n=1 Tax=Galaxaura rugosa TaxID=268570 RepID=A0A1G4NT58_9FLOR|nr:Ribosomal protein S17 [Galaxaura rugosa]SCW21805.1 Ribosomal protein S17 [Galaxaura rugosa]